MNRKQALIIALVVLALCGVALALFTYEIQNTMKVTASEEIVVYEHLTTNPITSIAWGDFQSGENKTLIVDLKNIGNVDVMVYWYDDLGSEWKLEIWFSTDDGLTWNSWSESTQGLNVMPDSTVWLKLQLTEVSASVDVEYSFTLTFESYKA
jgi:hypothetical protein